MAGVRRRSSAIPSVYNRWSEDLGGFREKVIPGALTKTLLESDIRVLFNHDPNFVLGRNRSGTAVFRDEAVGLLMTCTPPDTQTVRDLVLEPTRRGDINQMSFAFRVAGPAFVRHKASERVPSGTGEVWNPEYTERELHLLQMFDASCVTFPAYPATDAQVRSTLAGAGLDFDGLAAAIGKRQRPSPCRQPRFRWSAQRSRASATSSRRDAAHHGHVAGPLRARAGIGRALMADQA